MLVFLLAYIIDLQIVCYSESKALILNKQYGLIIAEMLSGHQVSEGQTDSFGSLVIYS